MSPESPGPPEGTEFGLHMLHRFGLTFTAFAPAAVALPLICVAQERLSFDHPGLGLRKAYSLEREVRTALSDHKALSVGIKYQLYEADPVGPGDVPPVIGHTLSPGYQVRLGYQHSALSQFGLAIGRDADLYSSAFDSTAPYPRQLSFTGLHWLTPSWAVSYDVLSADLDSPSPLRLQGLGLRFSLRYRF